MLVVYVGIGRSCLHRPLLSKFSCVTCEHDRTSDARSEHCEPRCPTKIPHGQSLMRHFSTEAHACWAIWIPCPVAPTTSQKRTKAPADCCTLMQHEPPRMEQPSSVTSPHMFSTTGAEPDPPTMVMLQILASAASSTTVGNPDAAKKMDASGPSSTMPRTSPRP